MHLSMISRDSMAMPSQQSGVSKAFDFKASTQVMQALGVRTRRNIRTTAEYLALSLGLKGEVTVAGMDFSEPKDMPELHQWRAAEEMGLTRDSPTYAKDIKKEHVRRQSDDSAPEKLKIIFSEIDNAADPVEVREEVLAG